LREHCAICIQENFTDRLNHSNSAESYFHNEHVYFAAGDLVNSWQLAELVIASTDDSLRSRPFQQSVYIKACIIRKRGLITLGINEYSRYLNMQPLDTLLKAESFLALSELYLKRHDLPEAANFSKKALDISFYTTSKSYQRRLYLHLAEVEEQRRNFQLALEYRNLSGTLADSGAPEPPVIQQAPSHFFPEQRINEEANHKPQWIVFTVVMLLTILLINAKFRGSRKAKHLSRAAENLERANKSKDQLFAIVSHDLRSYLYSLQLNVSRFKNGLSRLSKDELASIGDVIARMITSMQSLLNNLLYWSLGKTGQLSHQPEKIQLKPVLAQVCYDYVTVAASANVKLVQESFTDVSCTADVNALKLILRNVIENAIKFTPADGTITVSAYQQRNRCFILVRDTGIGIDPEKIREILTGDADRVQEDAKGRRSTGLGLVLVRDLVKKNDGEFNISSEKGNGTQISIVLPD
jgi:signal transduction histidine kinase